MINTGVDDWRIEMKTGTKLAILLFCLVAIAHFLRVVFDVNIIVDSWVVPQWISLFGILVPGLVAALLWKESK